MSIDIALPVLSSLITSAWSSELIKNWKDVEFETDYFEKLREELKKSLPARFPSLKTQMAKLISSYDEETLVLVLGAGVSVPYKLPNWDTLLQKLLLSSFQKETDSDTDKSLVLAKLFTKIFSPNPLIAARYLRNHYKENTEKDPLAFEKAIRKALYSNLKKNFQSPLFREIVQLCVAPGKTPNLNSIITYNYDDILETHLKEINISVPHKSISTLGVTLSSGELGIYHVHGYLPRAGRLTPTSLVTLSEDEYHQQYSNTYSWNNIVQINKFRENTCLFIGLSLTDPNIRRLLDIANSQRGSAKPKHYSIRKRYEKGIIKDALNKILKDNPEILDEKSKAKLKFDETINTLVKVMETFETKDDLSFGISTIWVDEHEHIPEILEGVRLKNNDVKFTKQTAE